MVEVAESTCGHNQGDVHDDEEDEVDHGEEVDCPGDFDRVELVESLGFDRPGSRHADSGDQCEGCGDKHGGEIGQELEAVVVDPAMRCRPVQRYVLDRSGHGVGEHVPTGGDQAHPLPGCKYQYVKEDAVEYPECVQGEVEP